MIGAHCGVNGMALQGRTFVFPANAGTTSGYDFSFSRQDASEVCKETPPPKKEARATLKRGRREDRVRAAPAVSCAICAKGCAHEHTGSAEAVRPSLRNDFNGFLRALPGDRLIDTVAPEKRELPKDLTPATGRQDHTTSPYAPASLVNDADSVHRIPSRVS